ncbi:hypothetical protein HZH68_012270 [Vespula germanica]|uniref:Uncharacterized protein n=1 Tax=Vespula germanica TaxID=30212 RepID=A0A834JH95_VESGE|nr:hypothetical protein HZH68_012270 [Vespula germanica]
MRVAAHESRPCALGPACVSDLSSSNATRERRIHRLDDVQACVSESLREEERRGEERRGDERREEKNNVTIVLHQPSCNYPRNSGSNGISVKAERTGQFEKILTSLSGFASFGLQPFGAFNPLIAEPEGTSITKKHFEPFQACLTKRSSCI